MHTADTRVNEAIKPQMCASVSTSIGHTTAALKEGGLRLNCEHTPKLLKTKSQLLRKDIKTHRTRMRARKSRTKKVIKRH